MFTTADLYFSNKKKNTHNMIAYYQKIWTTLNSCGLVLRSRYELLEVV